MNIIQQKIAKTGKYISIILFIVCTLTILGALLSLVAVGILLFGNNQIIASLQDALTVVSSNGSLTVPSTEVLITLLLFAAVQLIILFFVLFLLYRIFSDISRNYTPFEKNHVIRMKKVAVLTLVVCIFSNVFDNIANAILYGKTLMEINFVWLVVGIVIYCISYIFDYGYQLQTQSDETL